MPFDRERELEELDFALGEPGAHRLTMSGRRLGKTTLLVEWTKRRSVPFIFWVASRISEAPLLRSFSQAIHNHAP